MQNQATVPASAPVAAQRRPPADLQPSQAVRYLTPEEYSVWDTLVSASPQGSVLCRSWWLQAILGDVRVLGYFRGGRLVAGIPLYHERRFGVRVCRMPKLVHTWGVVMEPLEGRNVTVNGREMEILGVFARELARERIFVQSFHPTLLNWLPFYWEGFSQTTRFGYVLEDITDPDRTWEHMDSNVRRNIRKAQKSGIEIVPCNVAMVIDASVKTFRHQGHTLPYSAEYLVQLYRAAQQRDAAACFAAVDRDRRTHAATMIVWDARRAYYFVGGADPALRSSGAQSLLMWFLLQFASGHAAAFDFSGSVVPAIEHFFRGFGARLVPYNRVYRFPLPLRAALALTRRS